MSRVNTTIAVDPDIWLKAKVIAKMEDKTITDLLTDAFIYELDLIKNGKEDFPQLPNVKRVRRAVRVETDVWKPLIIEAITRGFEYQYIAELALRRYLERLGG